MKIYKPHISYIDQEDLEDFKEGKDVDVSRVLFNKNLFSKKQDCLNEIKKELSGLEEEIICSIEIEHLNVDEDSEYKCEYFDKNLNKIGFYSWNEEFVHKKTKYKTKDWILFQRGSKLLIGKIGAKAKGDKPYYVQYEDSYINDCSPHDHTSEYSIIMKLSDEKAKELLPRKYYENILLRHDAYMKYKKKKKKLMARK